MDWSKLAKYWRPDSWTFRLGGVLPIVAGLVVVFEPLHKRPELVEVVYNLAPPGTPGGMMIWLGFTIIAGRAAFNDKPVAPKEGEA